MSLYSPCAVQSMDLRVGGVDKVSFAVPGGGQGVFNRDCGRFPGGTVPVVDWLRIAAASHPTTPALITPDRTVSYAELDRAADAVAAIIVGSGLGGGTVAFWGERDPATAAAIWGIPAPGPPRLSWMPGWRRRKGCGSHSKQVPGGSGHFLLGDRRTPATVEPDGRFAGLHARRGSPGGVYLRIGGRAQRA